MTVICFLYSQVGHEPLSPMLGRNLFRTPVYQLPGLFAYAKHIVAIDGKMGLFRGLTPRLCAGAVGTVVHSKVLQVYQAQEEAETSAGDSRKQTSSLEVVVLETSREMIARSAATVITHPFHVITLRCMVQFIGRESKYNGIFDSVATIYREEGLLGFFAGLIPRLLGDVLSLWLCNLLAHLIHTYALDPSVSYTVEQSLTRGWELAAGQDHLWREERGSGSCRLCFYFRFLVARYFAFSESRSPGLSGRIGGSEYLPG
uniref:Mitochondrial carrier-like 2-like protein n=1 Tax=Callorhinchus milii TaxID=7868 RepID=V9L9Q6_CALMI